MEVNKAEYGEVKVEIDRIHSDIEMNVTKSIEGGSVEQMVKDLISKHEIIMFSKTTCAFSFELKRTLGEYGVAYAVFECNQSPQMRAIQQILLQMTGCATVPQLFIKGEFKGGCESMKALEFTGEFQAMLSPYITKNISKGPELGHFSIFYVPEHVNKYHVRIGGTIAFCYCILCAGFYNHDATKWAVLALAIDYLLRLIYGGSVSAIGMVAATLSARFPPVYAAGPPKHFAIFCCFFLSTWAAGLYLGNETKGGAVIICVLAVATGLEGIFDFCIGCWVFGFLLRFNLVPKTLYIPYLNFVNSRKWTWFYTYAKDDYAKVKAEHMLMPGQTTPTKVDLVRKVRLDTEYKLRDFDPIRHCRIEFYAAPMAVCALALAYNFVGNDVTRWESYQTSQTLAIVSVIMFFPILCLSLLRLAMYPKKFIKEWQHPTFGNFYGCFSIFSMMLGIIWLPDSRSGGATLIWGGALIHMAITVFRVSDLVYNRIAEDNINPSLMIGPVGNFIAAIAFPYMVVNKYEPNTGQLNYVQLGRLWFGIASLYAIVLFTITFRKAMHDHHSDNRLRPTLWIWLATSSIAGSLMTIDMIVNMIVSMIVDMIINILNFNMYFLGPAYFAVTGFEDDVAKGVLYQSLWCISLLFFSVNAIGWLRNFYNYVQDMSIWVMPFSTSAFALNTVQYLTYNNSRLFQILSIFIFAIASASTGVCGLHTVYWLMDMSLFKPRPKWNPLNFLKITHEAFRFAVPKYQTILMSLTPGNPNAIDMWLAKTETLLAMFMEHARHEDICLYPMIRRYFPKMSKDITDEHEEGHHVFHQIDDLIKEYRAGKVEVEPFLNQLKELYPKWGNMLLPHLRNEEETLTIAGRKYLTIEGVTQIIRDSYDLTPMEEWRRIMPFVIDNLPMPMWKLRYVKCLVWALPWRAHEIGLVLYHGCDTTTWNFFAQEMPELIPRGLPGWVRHY